MHIYSICTICQEDLCKKHDVITLQCGQRHAFCYECIYQWYIKIRYNKEDGSETYQAHSCPMCFQDGGLLPLREGYPRIYQVNSTEKHHDGGLLTVDKIHMVYNSCKCIDPITGDYCKEGGTEEIRPINKKYIVFICSTHYWQFREGVDFNHRFLGFLESPYTKITCECVGCYRRVIKKFTLKVNGKISVTLCNEHRKSYKNGSNIPLKAGFTLKGLPSEAKTSAETVAP